MNTYAERRGIPADFRVEYRFYSREEGGRVSPPQQHTRWDFAYLEDDPVRDGMYMIWPEFIDSSDSVLPEGPVPMSGVADMFVLSPEFREYHANRLSIGARGFFMEGPRRVAECRVVQLGSLQGLRHGS